MPLETEPKIKAPIPTNGEKYKVKDGDSWESIARRIGINVWKLIDFNFKTKDPREVNWYLRDYVGCNLPTNDKLNWRFSSSANPGIIYLPKKVMVVQLRYEVPNLRLIPQDKTLACWFASAQMLIQWRRNQRQMTEVNLYDPSEVPQYMRMHINNDAIPWVQIRQFAQDLGLVCLPLMSPTPETILNWLRSYGPIWADGTKFAAGGSYGHVVVIGGISLNPDQILILDPENGGQRVWHPMTYIGSILSDGANPNRNQFLLRLP